MKDKHKKIPQSEWHQSMRGFFGGSLYNAMIDNPKIVMVTMDLGYGLFDKIRDDFPDRFYNVGASEQAGIDICIGMALENLIPFSYTITPFYYRAFEGLRTYINHECINVKLIGSGRDDDYKHDGFSHNAGDICYFMDGFANIVQHFPQTKEEIPDLIQTMVTIKHPEFLSLSR